MHWDTAVNINNFETFFHSHMIYKIFETRLRLIDILQKRDILVLSRDKKSIQSKVKRTKFYN